jgi:hypothetical protein
MLLENDSGLRPACETGCEELSEYCMVECTVPTPRRSPLFNKIEATFGIWYTFRACYLTNGRHCTIICRPTIGSFSSIERNCLFDGAHILRDNNFWCFFDPERHERSEAGSALKV